MQYPIPTNERKVMKKKISPSCENEIVEEITKEDFLYLRNELLAKLSIANIRLNGRPIVALSQLGNGGILKEKETGKKYKVNSLHFLDLDVQRLNKSVDRGKRVLWYNVSRKKGKEKTKMAKVKKQQNSSKEGKFVAQVKAFLEEKGGRGGSAGKIRRSRSPGRTKR